MLRMEPNIDLIAGEPEPQLSENALRVLEKRYLQKDESGKVIETPRQLFWRVAWNLAQADRPRAEIVVDGDQIYAASYHDKVMAMSAANGQPMWTHDVGSYSGVALLSDKDRGYPTLNAAPRHDLPA